MLTFEQSCNTKIEIKLTGPGMGDNIIMSSLPENFFKNTGNKLIGDKNNHIFKNNPFIDTESAPQRSFRQQEICDGGAYIVRTQKNIHPHFSIPFEHCQFFSLPKCYLRHSRLYIYEDLETIHNKVCVHTTGVSTGGSLSDKIIERIKNNYRNYKIVQIGGKNDKKLNFAEDKTGLNIIDTAKEISESAIFIGLDSSNFHIANCYPKVRKKLIINYFSEEQFDLLSPLYKDAAWWDFNVETYNIYDYDIGCSMSYLKI